jgi:hypothetical protein
MTALTANADIRELAGNDPVDKFTIYNAEIMYAGGMVAVDSAGEVQMASNTAGLRVLGRCPLKVDNTADGETSAIERGIFRYTNSSSYPIARTAIGTVAYVEDDNIVAGYASNLVPAGIVHDVDSDGVWVDMTPLALAYAQRLNAAILVSKTDDYTVTDALAYQGMTYFSCDKASIMEITLPSAVAGMRVGVQRASATAAHDVTIQAATGDRIQASDGICAAGKQIDNTVDAVSGILWLRAVDATFWMIDPAFTPNDITSWVKNDT